MAGVLFTFEVASVLPFNGFAVVGAFGSGPDGNAAKDENTAWGVGTWASTALDLPYFNSGMVVSTRPVTKTGDH